VGRYVGHTGKAPVLVSLVTFNGQASGSDFPRQFWGELGMYTPNAPYARTVYLASGWTLQITPPDRLTPRVVPPPCFGCDQAIRYRGQIPGGNGNPAFSFRTTLPRSRDTEALRHVNKGTPGRFPGSVSTTHRKRSTLYLYCLTRPSRDQPLPTLRGVEGNRDAS